MLFLAVDRITEEKLFPHAPGKCYGCHKDIPGGAVAKFVPGSWVLKQPAAFSLMFCGRCSMPDGPPKTAV